MKISQRMLAWAAILCTPSLVAAEGGSRKAQGHPEHPNVLIFLLDDVGFGQLSAFGGPYRTPNIDRLAKRGLRFTNFHTASLCSPTRAALLTGRNHHSVGMATITETASKQPGYNGKVPKSAGTLSAILKSQGYETYALGKWHLTPQPESGIDGPFDRWPTGMGFDHWYGFQGADSDQWSPGLWQDTTPVEPPHDPGYHLTSDLADHAVSFLSSPARSQKPFLLYFATGAGHAPHQVPREWIDKNRGRFDEGWDVARERIFAQQKKLGIMPADAVLPERNPAIRAWDSLNVQEKELFTRMQEVHAGFIEHTDNEIGRVLDALEKSGQSENTLIILTSDNGASGEGGEIGSINEFRIIGPARETFAEVYAMLDKLGGPETYNHYPAGWAQAGNTPFRYWKQQAHRGGVSDPMIASWPARIKDGGAIRRQFSHVVDITPTVLEALEIEAPHVLGGVEQMPIEGVSMMASLSSAQAPSAKKVQYFEMIGNRGVWADGWKAVTYHGRLPWLQGVLSLPNFADDVWELYDLEKDPTESHDLSKVYPEKLQELKALFDREARKHKVFPLDGSGLVERASALQSELTRGVSTLTYDTVKTRIPESAAPWLKSRSHSITATVDIPLSGAQGVIVAHGGRFGGYSLYVKDNKLYYTHNYLAQHVYTLATPDELPHGRVELRFEFELTPQSPGSGAGIGRLFVNGVKRAEAPIPHTMIGPYGFADTFDIGSDTITPVAVDAYESPFAFSGNIVSVKFDMQPVQRPYEPAEVAH